MKRMRSDQLLTLCFDFYWANRIIPSADYSIRSSTSWKQMHWNVDAFQYANIWMIITSFDTWFLSFFHLWRYLNFVVFFFFKKRKCLGAAVCSGRPLEWMTAIILCKKKERPLSQVENIYCCPFHFLKEMNFQFLPRSQPILAIVLFLTGQTDRKLSRNDEKTKCGSMADTCVSSQALGLRPIINSRR